MNRPDLLDSLDRQVGRQHPPFELVRDTLPFEIVSRTESCEKCAMKVVAVRRTPAAPVQWIQLGDVYEVRPGEWKCQTALHTRARCAERAVYFRPLEGGLW